MKPFDLKAAKRGEPIQTADGRSVRFISHVPEADESKNVVVFIENYKTLRLYPENGRGDFIGGDLCMAPKLRTIWVNLYLGDDGERQALMGFSSKDKALEDAENCEYQVLFKAHKIEWEESE